MKFKNNDDSRYFVRFMPGTERLIKQLTVKEFIAYLEDNAVLEDEIYDCIDGKGVTCQVYNLKEENSKLHKEFLVTRDGRVFYFRTLNDKIEFEDEKEEIKNVLSSKIVWDETFGQSSYNFYKEAKKVEYQINKDEYVIRQLLNVNSELRTRMLTILEHGAVDNTGRCIDYMVRTIGRYLQRIYYVKEHKYMASIDLVLKKFVLERL